MVGFIPELEHFPPLAGQVSTWIQRPHSLVVNLCDKMIYKHINDLLRNQGNSLERGSRDRMEKRGKLSQHVTELLGTVHSTRNHSPEFSTNKPLEHPFLTQSEHDSLRYLYSSSLQSLQNGQS